MSQELNNDAYNQNRQRVIKHLNTVDVLLIVLPMTSAIILGFVAAFTTPDSSVTMFPGLGFIIFGFLFCGAYGFLALVFSLLTRRNKTFRLLLAGVLLIFTAFFCFLLFG